MSKERLEEIKNSYLVGIHSLFGTPWVSMPKENFDWLIEQVERAEELERKIERYREAIRKTKYAIHTQISSINHQENTELERKYLAGIMFASRMMDRYFNKALESDNE